jgi:hypothetical protein
LYGFFETIRCLFLLITLEIQICQKCQVCQTCQVFSDKVSSIGIFLTLKDTDFYSVNLHRAMQWVVNAWRGSYPYFDNKEVLAGHQSPSFQVLENIHQQASIFSLKIKPDIPEQNSMEHNIPELKKSRCPASSLPILGLSTI